MRRRQSRAQVSLLLTLSVLLVGCGLQDDVDIPTRYGLAQSVQGRQIVEQATMLVDAMLPGDFAMRLRPTWAPSGFFPSLVFESDRRRPGFLMEFITDRGFDNGFRF